MKTLVITLAVCAFAFAVDLPNTTPHIIGHMHNTTVSPTVNSTEVPLVNVTTTELPNANVSTTMVPVVNGSSTVLPVSTTVTPAPKKVREGRFVSLVNGYFYDRKYDVVLSRQQYYYVVNQPIYSVSRDIQIVY